MTYVLSVLSLGALCGAWVIVQRWIARRDPAQPGVEGKCGSCTNFTHDRDRPHQC